MLFLKILSVVLAIILLILITLLILYIIFKVLLNDLEDTRSIDRIKELKKMNIKIDHQIYSDKEIEKEPEKAKVNLRYFPGTFKDKIVIVIPGGAYLGIAKKEGDPVAAKLNRLGITAFVLRYRIATELKDSSIYEDLGRAINYIFDHREDFDIIGDKYALMGFSAGGHMALTFALNVKSGYKKYNLKRPDYIMAAYPAVNYYQNEAYLLLEKDYDKEDEKILDIWNNMDKNFPKTYLTHGEKDLIVPIDISSRRLVKLFNKKDIKYKYEEFESLGHGYNNDYNSEASYWINKAIKFWDE